MSLSVRKFKIVFRLPTSLLRQKSFLSFLRAGKAGPTLTAMLSHPLAHLRPAESIFFLAGFIKPRNLEVVERNFLVS